MMNSKKIIKTLNTLIPDPKCPLNYSKDYEILLATMLSAQSTDTRVNEVTKVLFKYSLVELANMDIKHLESIIKPVGTQHRKSEYIKNIATKLLNECDGKVPHDREYVESLPGIGHKTCNVVFAEVFRDATMPVDTHVSRVSKRLGLASETDDVVTIGDPTCGAGNLFLGAIYNVNKLLVDEAKRAKFQRNIIFVGQDIDLACVHMSYVQCAMLGYSGLFQHMDTLAQKLLAFPRKRGGDPSR